MDCNLADVFNLLGQLGLLVVVSLLHKLRSDATKSLRRDIATEFDRLLDDRVSKSRDDHPTPPPYNRL
jgi:hypothetical protein